MSHTISVTQGFLAQTLFETEQEVLSKPQYNNTGEIFNVAAFLLSEAFRSLMHSMAESPGYGVIGAAPAGLLEAVAETRYSDLTPEQKDRVDDNGRVLELLLRDPPARILILGLIEAYRALQEERIGEEVPQDAE